MLRVGIIGCGAIGKDHCRRIMELVPDTEVIAVSDYFKTAAEELADQYDLKVYDIGTELCASKEIDAVLIACSDPFHAQYTLAALENKKWVFCEKPLAQTADDCLKIMAAEEKLGKRRVQVGFMRRYDPGYAEMKRLIASGELGAPLMIHAAHRNVSQPDGFETPMAITNVCIHELDICRFLLDDEYVRGQVLSVRQSDRSRKGYDNPQMVLLTTKSGAQIDVEIQVADAYGYDIQCQVVCEKGTVNLPDPYAVTTRQKATLSVPLLTDWKDRFITAYDIELQEWAKAVKAGNLTGPSSWDGYAACVAADAINASRGTLQFKEISLVEKPAIY